MSKLNRWLLVAAVGAAMCLSVSQSLAQPNNDNNNRGGRNRNGNTQDQGGRPDFRNMDDAQRQKFFSDRIKERLEITDDTEWNAIQPMVQKVMDLERSLAADRMRGMFGGRRGGPGGGNPGDQNNRGQGMFGGTAMPEADALQKAIDGKASASELKAAVAKYNAAKKAKQAELEKAQAELRKVLSVRQEAIATAAGWL